MKKLIALVLAAVMALSLLGCAGSSGSGSAKKVKVGIVQLAEHVALDKATQGIKDALAEGGFKEGENIEIDFQNAQGDQSNLSTIADRFASEKCDLIFAIATPAAQAVAGKITDIPILATAVTSFESANLVDSDAAPGGNVSGSNDMNPVKEQVELIKKLDPSVETIGVIYNNGEINSVLQAKIAKETIESMGLKYEEVTVTSTNDVQQAASTIVNRCDALYLPTDNTVAASVPTITGITDEAKMIVVCGESGMLEGGGTATIGIDYYKLGKLTGEMGLKILKEGADVSKMPVESLKDFDYVIKKDAVDRLGITVPDDLAGFVS